MGSDTAATGMRATDELAATLTRTEVQRSPSLSLIRRQLGAAKGESR